MATLHDLTVPARTSRRSRSAAARRGLVVAGLLTVSLIGTNAATAAPGTITQADTQSDSLTAEIARVEQEIAAAEDTLARLTVEAEAAGETARVAEAALADAQAAAARTAQDLAAVRTALVQTQEGVAQLGREAYMGNDQSFGDMALLLDADSPTALLQQAATLELLGEDRSRQVESLEDAEDREARADVAAREALAEQDRAARAAADAEAAAVAALAGAQASYDKTAAEKAALDEQLRSAQAQLAAQQGVPAPPAAAVPAGAGLGALLAGPATVTSCYGSRWGTVHNGVDIAAPLGTPILAPEGGVVVEAGPATGFGLMVAIQHPDGTITLYGHINAYSVTAGQTVTAGQQIAEVGNRGLSTGAHVHVEVHTGGLYANRQNPVPWLAARGIPVPGC